MPRNQTSIIDDRGYNQGFKETFAQKKRMERRAMWMIKEMEALPNKKVLEVGCGTGYIAYYIALKTSMRVIGTDVYRSFIEEAKEKYKLPNLSYKTLDLLEAIKNSTDRYDYIIGNGILHHLFYDLDEVLSIIRNSLSPFGKILFMEPNIYNPYVASIFKNKLFRKWAKLEPGEMAFSKPFIQKKLIKAQFENIEISYKDFLLPGVPKVMVRPSILIGNVLEKTPLKYISQSLFIHAMRKESP